MKNKYNTWKIYKAVRSPESIARSYQELSVSIVNTKTGMFTTS